MLEWKLEKKEEEEDDEHRNNLEINWVHSVFNTACNIRLATYSLL